MVVALEAIAADTLADLERQRSKRAGPHLRDNRERGLRSARSRH